MNVKNAPLLALPLLLLAGAVSAQTPALTISDAIAPEGNSGDTDFVFTVTLAPAAAATVKVKWSTEPCTATPKSPCGTDDEDYLPNSGVLTFAPGQTTKTVTVKVFGDTVPEGQESFFVALSQPSNAVLAALPQGQGQGIIDNDDGALPEPPAADFNGDGRTDMLFRNATSGRLVVWLMSGLYRITGSFVTLPDTTPVTVGADWSVAGVADLDGDGDADVLLQNNLTGLLEYRYLNGLVQVDVQSRAGLATAWKIAGTADFDLDGKRDYLWRNQDSGLLMIWRMDDRTLLGSADLNPNYVPSILDPTVVDLAWKPVGLGDFNGDGHADVLFRNDSSTRLVVWHLDGVNRIAGGYLNPDRPIEYEEWPLSGVWDVDQNGICDVVFRNVTSNAFVAWFLDDERNRVCGTYLNPPTLTDSSWFQVGPR